MSEPAAPPASTEGGGIPDWDTADRMRKALRHAGLGVAEMAAYLEVSRTSVSNWINGRVKPSLRGWFATGTYRASGHNLRLVQELMGHKRPETTALYTLADQPAAAAAVESLPCPALTSNHG